LTAALLHHQANRRALPGVEDPVRLAAFVRQLVDSTRRTAYVSRMLQRNLSALRSDPNSPIFDPILGAIVCSRTGNVEEACWLAFLATHFGKALSSGWELCRAVYGRLGVGPQSTWNRTSTDVGELCDWIAANSGAIRRGPPPRRFGNHRKYESLANNGSRGTPVTFRTYVDWVIAAGSHAALLNNAVTAAENDRYEAFDRLYRSMSVVSSFGRLARFDYLSMLGKLRLAPIAAGSTYLGASTGPLAGAALLFFASPNAARQASAMDTWLLELGEDLHVTMQDLEDALCNWQKSPEVYRYFGG
jgi:hypothetical protein